ncbi:sulfotransferase domain-containing protein [Phenylobacterium sp.]|uniref:sulfotransferase domain-containing protein n=1 Tax=Phenylobacterium sp. TaxID=1871053 RepID=UPI002F4085D9
MNQEAPRRARSLAEMGRIQGRLLNPDEIQAAVQGFRPQPGDIIISPFGKSGTTRLQQAFHTLRTGGDMDFDDISRVVPWIETSRALGLDLQAPQKAEPRGFKSHLPYDLAPKGARYVISLRDPKDALVSVYRFMEGWFMEPGAIPMAEFAQGWLGPPRPGNDYWRHLLSWWEQRDNPDVLLFSYGHMNADPEGGIRRLAAFCGIPLDDALLARTLENASLPFMLRHKDRFDDLMMREASETRCNLPPGSDSAKVRNGRVGEHRTELPPGIAAGLDAIWAERVTPLTGFADYAALEAELRRRNGG